MGNILIVAEQKAGALRSASLNAISFARKLRETRGAGDLIGLVIGQNVSGAASELAGYGLTKVISVDHASLGGYMAETYAPVVAQVAKAQGADLVCGTSTSMGKDLLPRVAALLGAGMASEVSGVLGPKSFRRPMLAGNVVAKVEVTTAMAVVSVRQTEWAPAAASGSSCAVETADAGAVSTLGAQVVKLEAVTSARPDLTDAKVVVSGGRGMKAAENFKHLEAIADLLGGAVGATRAACDAGLVPNDLQVGQTGKVVAPNLYVAVAISGAIQHLAGMKGSKVIVAINKDPEAPIFQVADYGLVAKWEDVLPELTEKLKAVKASQ
ncbi:MAG: electron transfer flavoprotein subunit alpha/FixB family protein [Deltaproteobacteria bacterium]|nr:electron transfer flavoprotein subunit alpha/FixB family protein [Deltaproteobacteria bacterium]